MSLFFKNMVSQYFLEVWSLFFHFPVVSFEEQILSFGEYSVSILLSWIIVDDAFERKV